MASYPSSTSTSSSGFSSAASLADASRANAGTPTPKPVGAGRAIACRRCNTYITSSRYLVSRAYRGFRGKAALYRTVSEETTSAGPPTVQLMQTGAYTVRALTCTCCNAYLGWQIARASEESEAWKEGHAVLELQCVGEQEDRGSLDDELRGNISAPAPAPVSVPAPASEVQRRPGSRAGSVSGSVWRKTIVAIGTASRLGAGRGGSPEKEGQTQEQTRVLEFGM